MLVLLPTWNCAAELDRSQPLKRKYSGEAPAISKLFLCQHPDVREYTAITATVSTLKVTAIPCYSSFIVAD